VTLFFFTGQSVASERSNEKLPGMAAPLMLLRTDLINVKQEKEKRYRYRRLRSILHITEVAPLVDGQKIRLAGQGAGRTPVGPPADLYLVIKIQPHPLFRLRDKDISVDLSLAPWEAALGAKVEVPTPTGRINLNIPGGSQAGRRLRLRGRGLPGDPPGDFGDFANTGRFTLGRLRALARTCGARDSGFAPG